MNRRFHGLPLLLGGGLLGVGAASALVVACGGDDNAALTDSGVADGTIDVAADTPVADGAAADSLAADGPAADRAAVDSTAADSQVADGPTGDGTPDGSVTDREAADGTAADGADAQTESGDGADGMPNADATDSMINGDATDGMTDSQPDVADAQYYDVPPLQEFPHAVNTAYCTWLQQCCLVPTSQWNQAGCVNTYDTYGGFRQIGSFGASLDSGLLAYSQLLAAKCLKEVSALNCGMTVAASLAQLQRDCYATMQGTLGVDAGPCRSSNVCATGEYCRIAGDAGTGVCVALATVGEPCTDTSSSFECTYLGTGQPALFCGPSADGGPTCQNALGSGSVCDHQPECRSLACNPNVGSPPSCVDSFVLADPGDPNGTCAFYTLPDAGGGG